MNKPIAVAQAILDKSKELMYEFWYDIIKPMYKDKPNLSYMDTDSFVIDIQTDDVFKDFEKIVHKWFDKSAYGDNIDKPITKKLNKRSLENLRMNEMLTYLLNLLQ